MDQSNQQNQVPHNPNTPISEVLKQEQAGFVPSSTVSAPQTPTLSDVVGAMGEKIGKQGAQLDHQARIIKTYRSDAEEAVRLQQASVVKVAVAQNEQRIEQQKNPTFTSESTKKPKKHILVPIFVVIIMLALGAAAIPAVQYLLKQKTTPVVVLNDKTIIPFDHKDAITLQTTNHDNLGTTLDTVPPNTSNVDYIEISQKIIDANQKTVTIKLPTNTFATILGNGIPSSLVRSFDTDYMYGIDGIKHPRPFILFKTSSYDQAFAGMLKWETKMIADLTPILNISSKIANQPFVDNVITSKDVRSASSQDGSVYFIYGFIDNQTLLITTDTEAFKDIANRYIAGRFVQ